MRNGLRPPPARACCAPVRTLAPILLLLALASPAAAQDAGRPDAGPPDAGPPDAGPPAAGGPDAGAPDGGDPDAGGRDAGGTDARDAGPPPADAAPEVEEESDVEPAPAPEPEPEEAEYPDDLILSDDDVLVDPDLDDVVESEEDLTVPDVVVTAPAIDETEQRPTGGAVQRLGEEELERFSYDNPDAVVQQVPGAYVRQEDGFGLRPNIGLRGVSSERSSRITLMEDGILFGPAPYAAPAAYYFPLMLRMTGVDVYMGAATIPFGPTTVGGAIDLHNREIPREASGGVDLALGTYLYGRAHAWAGASNDWGGFVAEGVFLRSDGFKSLQGFEASPNTGFDRGELVLRGELRGAVGDDAYQRLELRLGFSAEGSNESYLGLTDTDFAADPYQRYFASQLDRMEWWRTQVQLRHTLEVGDGFVLRSAAYRHDLTRNWFKVNAMGGLPREGGGQTRTELFDVLLNPSGANAVLGAVLRGEEDGELGPASNDYVLIGNNGRVFGSTGVQTEGVGTFETGPLSHRVRVGARLHHDDVFRHHTEGAFGVAGGELIEVTEQRYTLLRTEAQALALSAHAAWSVELWDAVTVTPGVRTELIWTSYDDRESGMTNAAFRAAVLPGAGLEWQIIDELALFGGVMRGFAPVAPGQAEGVQPEDSVLYEAGVRASHEGSGLGGQITGFVNDYTNFLQRCSFAAGCADMELDREANGGRPIVAGLDVRLGASLRFDEVRVPLRATYTFTYTELREAVGDSPSPLYAGGQPGDRLPYIPEHQISAQAGVEHEDIGLNVSASWVSEMWEQVAAPGDDLPRTDAVFLLDATFYLGVLEHLRIYVRGENLTFSQAVASRRPFGARPVRPFQIQGGVKLEF